MADEGFGVRLKRLREGKGFSQKQLGEKIGVRRETIARYETGGNAPSWERVVALAEALGVSLDAFKSETK